MFDGFEVRRAGAGTHKRSDRTFGGAVSPPPPPPPGLKGRSGWWVAGRAADWYLSPAKGGYDFSANLYDLIGAPGLPPRYAMGFMATCALGRYVAIHCRVEWNFPVEHVCSSGHETEERDRPGQTGATSHWVW